MEHHEGAVRLADAFRCDHPPPCRTPPGKALLATSHLDAAVHSASGSAMGPLVSVLIPAYNASQTIMRALQSVWRQTYRPVEIIVVDDGSTDHTKQLVRPLARDGVRLVSHVANQGAAAARNSGLREATGEYVAFLDADDEWLPDKLERQVALMEQSPRCRIVTCDSMVFLTTGETMRVHTVCPATSGADAWKALLVRSFIPTPTVLARRSDLMQLNGFDPTLTIGEDLDMWIRLALTGDVEVIPEVMVNVYFRPDSLMRTHVRGELDFILPMITSHVHSLSHRLTRRERRLILGVRHFEIGYRLYQHGVYLPALPHFWRSVLLRFRVAKSLTFFPRTLTLMALTSLLRGRLPLAADRTSQGVYRRLQARSDQS